MPTKSKTEIIKGYKVIWPYGTRTYESLSEVMRNNEFGFFFEDAIYMTVDGNRIDIVSRIRKMGMFIRCEDHMKAIEAAEFLALYAPHCKEICLIPEHNDKPLTLEEALISEQQE